GTGKRGIEADRPEDQREPGDQDGAPQDDQDEERDGSIRAEVRLAPVAGRQAAADRGPGLPGHPVEDLGDPNAGYAPREDHRFEPVTKRHADQDDADQTREELHPRIKPSNGRRNSLRLRGGVELALRERPVL